jgi:hypothetical protein
VKSLGRATAAIFDLGVAQALFHKAGYDRILVAGRGDLRAALAGRVVVCVTHDDDLAGPDDRELRLGSHAGAAMISCRDRDGSSRTVRRAGGAAAVREEAPKGGNRGRGALVNPPWTDCASS